MRSSRKDLSDHGLEMVERVRGVTAMRLVVRVLAALMGDDGRCVPPTGAARLVVSS